MSLTEPRLSSSRARLDPTDLVGRQRTLDELGTPLCDVTFCVVDLETTGGSPTECAITEIGAVKLRGGECVGTFQTLVNPGAAIPPRITVITGITESMVATAPRIETVLPAFLEFVGGAVLVAHNARFDMGFLGAALERDDRPPLQNTVVDTCTLARRLLAGEVPNNKLGTLASRLRLDHQPNHRALDDALATGDLLHVLLERAAGHGVYGLDDLVAVPKMINHPQAKKLSLTDDLPRSPGVYLFRDRRGDPLYVGKATNLRSRVRSYFSTDTRRKVGALLREVARIDHLRCHHPLEASVRELRLIQQLQPRYNSQGRKRRAPCFVKLTLGERFPRLSIVRKVKADGGLYLGPIGSHRQAQAAIEAIHTAAPLRRCTQRVPRAGTDDDRPGPCASAQLGVAMCPCSGGVSEAGYREVVDRAVLGLTAQPELLLRDLEAKMHHLAAAERFEEAGDMRHRAQTLRDVLERRGRVDRLRQSGTVVLDLGERGGAELIDGCLTRSWGPGGDADQMLPFPGGTQDRPAPGSADEVAELLCVHAWLARYRDQYAVVEGADRLSLTPPALPNFSPRRPPAAAR